MFVLQEITQAEKKKKTGKWETQQHILMAIHNYFAMENCWIICMKSICLRPSDGYI